jgi:hypothetical protein
MTNNEKHLAAIIVISLATYMAITVAMIWRIFG